MCITEPQKNAGQFFFGFTPWKSCFFMVGGPWLSRFPGRRFCRHRTASLEKCCTAFLMGWALIMMFGHDNFGWKRMVSESEIQTGKITEVVLLALMMTNWQLQLYNVCNENVQCAMEMCNIKKQFSILFSILHPIPSQWVEWNPVLLICSIAADHQNQIYFLPLFRNSIFQICIRVEAVCHWLSTEQHCYRTFALARLRNRWLCWRGGCCFGGLPMRHFGEWGIWRDLKAVKTNDMVLFLLCILMCMYNNDQSNQSS